MKSNTYLVQVSTEQSAALLNVAVALSVPFPGRHFGDAPRRRYFIRHGLHAHGTDAAESKRRPGALDRLQAAYNRTIVIFMRRKPLAVALGSVAVIRGRSGFPGSFPGSSSLQPSAISSLIYLWMPQGYGASAGHQ